MKEYNNQAVSFWFDQLDETIQPRASLQQDLNIDVAIVGAGYTGLWTAYYLKKQQPELSIAIVESEVVGFGASGRNGGWLMGDILGKTKYLEPLSPKDKAAGYQLIFGIVDEVKRVIDEEGIDCDFQRGGSIYAAARYPEQLAFQKKYLEYLHKSGLAEADYCWLSAAELKERVRVRNGQGGIYTPHCAVINPAKLVRGLARVVERLGVQIFEQSSVLSIANKTITTAKGSITAKAIVPATEGFSGSLMGLQKYILPLQSLLIVTEPLSEATWQEIGLDNRETISDAGRMATYGQRTADNRMAFGARGGYVFGGKVQHAFSLDDPAFRVREKIMRDLFPALQNATITHGWGGSLGIARKFAPFAVFDPKTGIASAGGYGGEGVGAANLFARTLADLILGKQTQLTDMPWVFTPATHKSAIRRWEPEPFRWLTYKLILQAFSWEEDLYLKGTAPRWVRKSAGFVCDKLGLLME